MMRRKSFLLGAILAGIAIAGLAPPAQAVPNFQITVFINGVDQGVTTLGTANSFFVNQAIGGGAYNINFSSITNWSGSTAAATESNSVTGLLTVAAPITLATPQTVTVVISESFWLAPSGALMLSSSAGGSIASGGTPFSVSSTNQGFVDNTNTLATTVAPGGTSTPLANAAASVGTSGTSPLVYSPSPATNLAPGGTPFALTEKFTFTVAAGQTLVSGDGENVSGSVNVAPTVVPVPAGFVLALTGFPVLSVGAWFRRRRQPV